MSRDCVKEYLDPVDGVRVTGELEEIIEQHPKIKTVVLFWCWTQDYFTSHAGPFEAYVSESRLDEEYSFFGDREDAIKFAQDYDCWDGETFVILKDDILYGYCCEADLQTSWHDGYDHSGGISEGIDPSWYGWLRVDFDYKTGTEYLLAPDKIPEVDE